MAKPVEGKITDCWNCRLGGPCGQHDKKIANDKTKKDQLTDIGGKCPNCGQEENWLVLDRQRVEGSQYDIFYEIECQGEIRHDPLDEMGVGEIETCKCKRDITICEEPEWERPDED